MVSVKKTTCKCLINHINDTLATRDNLIRRGVKIEDPKCLLCHLAYENGCHLFVKCKEVKNLWRELGYENLRVRLEHCCDIEAVMYIIWGLHEEQKVQIITMWWLWWKERNRIKEGDLLVPHTEQAHRVKCMAAEFVNCYRKNASAKPGPQCWRPPQNEVIKFNVDGAFVEGH
jgi:hypothetical protein